MLRDLPLDLKIVIASYFEHVWVSMAICDPLVREYSTKYAHMFVNIFATNLLPKSCSPNEASSTTFTKIFGRLHSINMLPAVEYTDGIKFWYYNGLLHKDNAPAITTDTGDECWYRYGVLYRPNNLPQTTRQGKQKWFKQISHVGYIPIYNDQGEQQFDYNVNKLHRENDLPAVCGDNGRQEWKQNGEYYRENDLPVICLVNGTCAWVTGKGYHRENDLPAVIYSDGRQDWYKNGQRHREGIDKSGELLPAVIHAYGHKEWWINGDKIQ